MDPTIMAASSTESQVSTQAVLLREAIKAELKASWEPELKQVRKAAERKKGRELAARADHNYEQGRIVGICEAASFFISKDRIDIAEHLLTYYMIEREKAEAALQADKRTKSLTLGILDKADAWRKQPPLPFIR